MGCGWALGVSKKFNQKTLSPETCPSTHWMLAEGIQFIAVNFNIYFLHHNIYNMESKIFLQNYWRFFYPMFANCVHTQNYVLRKCSLWEEIRLSEFGEVAKIAGIAYIAEIPKIAGQCCWDCRPTLLRLPRLLKLVRLPRLTRLARLVRLARLEAGWVQWG